MPRVRTLPEAVKHIKATDPESALTPHALRLLVLRGEFPHIKIGSKRLVCIDLLEDYLRGDYIPQQEEKQERGVRALPERLERRQA
ncbi:MAG: hypothetical protein FWH22_11330 [Fibromonadales bacterium]|nr:hypothetical protein [Fibromonadales bacterium]